jgi:hypothetical protein
MANSLVIGRPQRDEYPDWAAGEIEEVPYSNLLFGLADSYEQTHRLLAGLTEENLRYRYAPGKWSIREMWQHVLDVERVLSYRALRYAREDQTVLSGFDADAYVLTSGADGRSWPGMLEEYGAVRKSTLALFASFSVGMAERRGTTGRSTMTVRALGYLMLGHEIHHGRMIRERYL